MAGNRGAGDMALAQANADFWPEEGAVELAAPALPNGGESAQIAGGQRRSLVMALFLALAITGWGAYLYFIEGKDPVEEVLSLVRSFFESDAPPKPQVEKQPAVVAKTVQHSHQGRLLKPVAGNPYWALPNRLLQNQPVLGRPWTAEEEEALRGGLAHKWAYQRYKTVLDVRKSRLRGSEVILWEALQDKKFWTRMNAALGLAEIGSEVSVKVLEPTLVNARSELIANWLERWAEKPTAAQTFLARQILRLLDERGRLVALKVIAASRDSFADLYLVAANEDPQARVKNWSELVLSRRNLPPERRSELLNIVRGEAEYEDTRFGVRASSSFGTGPSVQTEADLDQENPDDPGDVELYDSVPQKESEKTDPQTFEYDE